MVRRGEGWRGKEKNGEERRGIEWRGEGKRGTERAEKRREKNETKVG